MAYAGSGNPFALLSLVSIFLFLCRRAEETRKILQVSLATIDRGRNKLLSGSRRPALSHVAYDVVREPAMLCSRKKHLARSVTLLLGSTHLSSSCCLSFLAVWIVRFAPERSKSYLILVPASASHIELVKRHVMHVLAHGR